MKIHIPISIFLFFFILEDTNQHTLRKRSPYARHVPSNNVPSFRRDAVEQMPSWEEIIHRSMPYTESYGSKSLPLRAAVESVPDVLSATERLPLRDSVERRPMPDDGYDNNLEMIPDLDFQRKAFGKFPEKIVEDPEYGYYSPKNQFEALVRNSYSSPVYRVDNSHQQLYYQPIPSFPYYNYRFGRSAKSSRFDNSIMKEKKVVCYIQGASSHRKEPLAFEPEHLDPFACTHVIYAFANLDPHTFQVTANDDYDVVQGGYLSVTMLKHENPELKILLSVGGPKEQSSNRYSQMVTSAFRRRAFINSLIKYIKQYQFDGVDLYWLNPGDEEYMGHASDKEYYLILLEEISEIFRQHNWILSVSAPANRFRVEDGFDPAHLNKLVDFVNLQAYDFQLENSPAADHPAPLKPRDSDEDLDRFNNVDYSVRFWLKKGLSRDKLILGLPFFGRSYTLQGKESELGAPIKGPGQAGYYTQRPGFLAYFEICDMLLNENHEWQKGKDDVGSPFITDGEQWIGYDDVDSIERKVKYMKDMELGGAFIWSADLDDFKGLCGDKWPLLRALKRGLTGDIHSYQPEDMPTKPYGTCDSDGLYSDRRDCTAYFVCKNGFSYHLTCGSGLMFNPETGRCEYIEANVCRPGQTVHIPNAFRSLDVILRNDRVLDSRPKVVCYLTNWAFYRKGEGKFVPEHLDNQLCSHIVYAFASLDPETLLLKEFDPWADLENNLYNRVTAIHDVKILLSLGGWTDSSGDKYSRLVSDGSARRKFVVGVVSFLRKHNFDGLHLDWNYPVCWQSNCNRGAASDKPNFSKLAMELKREFNKQNPPLILAAAISGYKEVIDVAYDFRTLGNELDFMSVMTYDYHGSWERQTGHVSPSQGRPGELYPQYTSEYALEYLVQQGAPKNKLVMGIPFYGQTFTLAKTDAYAMGAPAVGAGEPGEYTKQPGMLAYYEICNRVKRQYWQTAKDPSGPYAYYGNQWVGYDSIESAYEKSRWVKNNNYGGVVAWTVDLDDFTNRCCQGTFPLLRSINRGLGLSNWQLREDCTKPSEPVTPTPPSVTTGIDSGSATSEASWTTTERQSTVWWVPESTTTEKKTTEKPTTTTTRRTTTTMTPTWTSTTVPPPAVVMPDKEPTESRKCSGNSYQPDPQNCNAYYRCILGEYKKQYCVGTLHWNRESNICDWPVNAKCENMYQQDEIETTFRPSTQRPTPPRTTTMKTTIKTTKRQRPTTTPANLQACNSGQYYTHEQCSNFYVCVNGNLVSQQCAPGLQWNAKEQMCDWGYKVKCMNRKQIAASENEKYSKVIAAPVGLPNQSCESGTFAGFDSDCTQYLICMWGKYEPFTCADGLHWNSEGKICDWPENAKCEGTPAGGDTGSGEVPRPTKKPTTTTTTTEYVPEEPFEPNSGYYKIVCYFTNWAWYRKGYGKYVPEDIDPNLCTHIVYGFAVLDYTDLIIKPHDSWADTDNKFYERVVAYKKKGLKVTMAIGGWNDSQGDKYSRLVNSPAARAKFITNVIEFLEKHNFDGLDLDWEYPKCWQVNCNAGPDSDKAAFGAFVRELHAAFKTKGLLLSAAVSPSKLVIDAGYDVPALAASLDWVAVMTYDYHGQWDKQTGHVAPMYVHPDDEVTFFNTNYTINYWISEGVPSRKIVMGMPLYGQSFHLENRNNHGLNAKATGPGQAGEFTRAAGFLAYYEICDLIKNHEWTVVHDPKMRIGPYAYSNEQWVSFDDKDMIRHKSEYIRKMNLGGGMIWALDLDDFKNRCGGGRHPLLSTIRRVLGPAPSAAELAGPQLPQEPVVVEGDEFTDIGEVEQKPTVPHSGTDVVNYNPNSEYKVVCYFTNWAWYRQGNGKYLPSDIDPDLCTHIVYGFAVLNGDEGIIKPHDTWADFDNKFYEKVTAYKAKGIKVLIAIGGWNDSAGDKYSKLVNNPSARRKFIAHVVDFIGMHNFDGLDLDWEYPKCWQVNCDQGPASDKAAFGAFVKELSEAFKPKGWLLSAAVSPSRRVIDAGYEVPTLSQYLDWIAVMAYDYHGQWDKVTGHVAPMYAHPEDADVTFNTNATIHYWIQKGADPKKLVLGMPTYGQSFSLADNNDHGLNAPTYGGGEAGDQTRARGFLSYYEICQNIKQKRWKVIRDRKGRIGPYAYLRDQWVSFDDRDMIRYKSEYIKSMGLGGGMIWALDLDDFRNLCNCETYPLLKTINRVLRDYKKPEPQCVLEDPLQPDESGIMTTRKPTTTTEAVTWWKPEPPTKPSWEEPSTTEAPNINQPVQQPDQPGTDMQGQACRGNMFESHETDCTAYYLCIHGILQLQRCSGGLYWSKDHCDWPANTQCQQGVPAVPQQPQQPEPQKPDPEPIAVTKPDIEPTTYRPTYKPSKITTSRPGASNDEKMVVCYFTNWAWYRQDAGKYLPSDIDADLCTHITYGFAVLDPNNLTIKTHDSWADIDNAFYEKVVAYKKKGIKVLIAIGGWNDSLGDKYSRLVNNPASRAKFIENVIRFIEKYGFDGLDLDWEYPKCWQVNCDQGPESDKAAFAQFVAELRAAFNPRGWLLSAAVSPSKAVIDAGYDVPSLSQNFDWIAVMCYDYHGQWDKKTGHVAPLYYYPGDDYDYFNINYTIHYWMELGADPKKLILGMPLYGQSFSLADANEHGLNAKTYGPGTAGDFTRAGGFLAFYEICGNVKRSSWKVVRDPEGRIGPYAYSGNQWVSYDDIADLRRKSELIKEWGLGGGMIWALDLDDFRNRCGCGKSPLLRNINNVLRGVPLDNQIENCT